MKKIGFVTPWYGETISGGAEAELRNLVHQLLQSGMKVEILTTCVQCFASDWNIDFHPAGLTEEAGVPVRRFSVRRRDTAAFDQVNYKLIHAQPVTDEEEAVFCREMVNSPELEQYLREHAGDYAVFVFIPYMFGTTWAGVQIHPEKSVMIPCLHDENYAHMRIFREPFSRVRGMIFLSEPERLLARRLYGVEGKNYRTLGGGLDTDWSYDPERFRRKYGIREPFILYAGRKDTGKKVDVLVRYFAAYKKRHHDALKLVLIGGGNVELQDRENILDLGFVDIQDKYDAYGAAAFFCNPSQMESFSLVVMESWLAGRPVLVNGACAVTRDFVCRTDGGLYYENYAQFEKCVEYLTSHPAETEIMGRNGREYVLGHFSWKVIVEKYRAFFEKLGAEA